MAVAAAGLLAAAILTPAMPAGAAAAAPAPVQAQHVPWSEVGSGWVLDQYTVASPSKPGPATLYLFSPQGTRYRLASWPDSDTAPQLLAWSPDGTRALFTLNAGKRAEQLNLATGKATTFTLAGGAVPTGYTTPRGADIVGAKPAPRGNCLPDCDFGRFSQDGTLIHSLGSHSSEVLYTARGTEFVTSGSRGLELASSNGAAIRQLRIPGMEPTSCAPVRWWGSSTMLALCYPPDAPGYTSSIGGAQLWLVPVSGARPTALTGQAAPDEGYSDAWKLGSGVYLDGGCSQALWNQSSRNPLVTVPGTKDDDVQVVTAVGSRLLVVASASCFGTSSGSLLWFNPATDAEQWLMRVPEHVYGTSSAIAFYSRDSAMSCAAESIAAGCPI